MISKQSCKTKFDEQRVQDDLIKEVRAQRIADKEADRAEEQARSAEYHAKKAKAEAGCLDDEEKAFLYKAKVATTTAMEYAEIATKEKEAWSKYDLAKEETEKERQSCSLLIKTLEAQIKRAEAVKRAVKKMRVERDVTNRKLAIQAKIKELEQELEVAEERARKAKEQIKTAKAKVCRAEDLEKKSKQEALKTSDAISAKVKYEKIACKAKEDASIRQVEAALKYAEAEARSDEATQRKKEGRAWRRQQVDKAKELKAKAMECKRKALEKRSEFDARRAEARDQKLRQEAKAPPKCPARIARASEKKYLSTNGMLKEVRETFQTISNKTKKGAISLCDCLMSGLAIFGLKYPSLLQFDQDSREGGCIEQNLQTLYGLEKAPNDTTMRERLDKVDPKAIRPAFKKIFSHLQHGKELKKYDFYEGCYLVAGDGTEPFSSKEVHCDNCCKREHKDGRVTYYHQMMSAAIVHPDHETVIPFCPEPIIASDGLTKNDCERNASERLYRHIRREHPHLSIIVTEDALHANGPHLRVLQELNMNFIIVVTPEGNKTLFEHVKEAEEDEYQTTQDGITFKFSFVNDVPLNDANPDMHVNFFEVWAYDAEGNERYHNSWITNIVITKKNVYTLHRGGRAKWKIENETFNTLKNQGYAFEHNFGHGKQNLCTIFAFLMFLAFLIDQVGQSCCGLFQAALEKMKSKVRLWGRLRAYFFTLYIASWEDLWRGLAYGLKGGKLILDTS